MKFAPLKCCLLSLLVTGCAGLAQAETITQTVTFPAQLLYEGATPTTHIDTFTATFNQFDPSLGTLDAVDFLLDFDFDVAISAGGGGSIAGDVYFTDPGVDLFFGGGNGFGGGPGTHAVDQLYDTTMMGSGIGSYYGNFTGVGTVDVSADMTFSAGPIPNVQLALVDDMGEAQMTLTYTYTQVPEPATLGLLALAGCGLLVARARRR